MFQIISPSPLSCFHHLLLKRDEPRLPPSLVNLSLFHRRCCLIAFLVGVAVKLGLIWTAQIADATDDPHEYMLQILYPPNGGLTYPPGTGIIGRLFFNLGIPYRLGIEVSFLFATTLVLRALFTWPWQSYLALGLFLLTIFDPVYVELFSHLYSDPVWLIETLLGASCLVLAFRHEDELDWKALVLALCFFGLAMVTRSVAVPLLLSTILYALLALALLLVKFRSARLKRSLDLLAFTIPTLVMGIFLIYLGVCRYNLTHHGYAGISYIDSSEYKRFYLCLQSVGEPDGERYFPIDENRRQLIAKAGPHSQWFVQQLDTNTVYQEAGRKNYGKYDIPAGWFHWAAFTASMDPAKGDYMTSFALFKSIEDEIAAADRDGLIKVRPILSLPDSRIPIVAGAFPSGMSHTLRQLIHEPRFLSSDVPPLRYDNPDFTKALTRPQVKDLTSYVLVENVGRDLFWENLRGIYSLIYTRATIGLFFLSILGFISVLFLRWSAFEEFPMIFVARLFLTVLFGVHLFWYALFDASGMPVTARYMVLNHLLLIPLICFYFSAAIQLFKHNRLTD